MPQTATRLLKTLLYATSAVAMVFAGFVLWFYLWLVPNLDTVRPRIAAYASEQLGVDVQIDHLQQYKTQEAFVWLPSLEAQGVRLGDLALEQVRVRLSPHQLLRGFWDSAQIDGATLPVRRDKEGLWHLAGFALKPSASTDKPLLDWLLTQPSLTLKNTTLTLVDDTKDPRLQSLTGTWQQVDAQLVNSLGKHQLTLHLAKPNPIWAPGVPKLEAKLEASSGLLGKPSDWGKWTGVSAQMTSPDVYPAKLPIDQIEPIFQLPQSFKTYWTSLAPASHVQGLVVSAKEIPIDAPTNARVQASFKAANADAALDAQVAWSHAAGIDLKANITRVDLSKLASYLPTTASELRRYLQSALLSGTAKNGVVHIKGKPEAWETFQVTADATDLRVQFAPNVSPAKAWPLLTDGSAKLTLTQTRDVLGLKLSQIDTQFDQLPLKGELGIANLQAPELLLTASSTGTVTQGLSLLSTPALKDLLNNGFANLLGSGALKAQLQLRLPLGASSTVERDLQLSGDVQLDQATLGFDAKSFGLGQIESLQTDARIGFTQSGLSTLSASGQVLGGRTKVQSTGTGELQIEGRVSDQGVRAWVQHTTNPAWQNIASKLQGTTDYRASYHLKTQDWQVSTSLQGMALNLPEPLKKAREAALLLVVSSKGQTFSASLGELAQYAEDASRTLRLNIPRLSTKEWLSLLPSQTAGDAKSAAKPLNVSAQIGQLDLQGRQFAALTFGAGFSNGKWRVNALSDSINGYAEYWLPSSTHPQGHVLARLAKLDIPDNNSRLEVESALGSSIDSLPSVDLLVEDFELTGRKFGQLALLAVNQRTRTDLSGGKSANTQSEWRIQNLSLTLPELQLKSSGVWATPNAAKPSERRMDMQFEIDSRDSGAFLTRLGVAKTLKDAPAALQGRVAWMGTPLALHYPSMTGQMKLSVGRGQFLKIDPGAGRLLSVLSLQALPKIVTLDFKDVFSEGFAFDTITGDALIEQGVLRTETLQMKSNLAVVELRGGTDLGKETQDLRALILPDVNVGGASVMAAIFNPVLGALSYIAQLVLQRPILRAATREYHISGTWKEPKVVLLDKPSQENSTTEKSK